MARHQQACPTNHAWACSPATGCATHTAAKTSARLCSPGCCPPCFPLSTCLLILHSLIHSLTQPHLLRFVFSLSQATLVFLAPSPQPSFNAAARPPLLPVARSPQSLHLVLIDTPHPSVAAHQCLALQNVHADTTPGRAGARTRQTTNPLAVCMQECSTLATSNPSPPTCKQTFPMQAYVLVAGITGRGKISAEGEAQAT